MATGNRAEVMDFIERFNFNLGNAIQCIARAGCKPASGIIAELEKAHWYLEREIERMKQDHKQAEWSSQSSANRPGHRYINSAKVNRTAPYGKTGWVTNIDPATAHGNIRPRAKTIGNQYVSTKFSPTSAHTHQ